jgi:hypothetical protein
MCIGGNNANHVSDYVNAQLAALHKIARYCVKHYDDEKTDKFIGPKFSGYDIALAEFHQRVRSKDSNFSSQFEASFGVPEIEFACTHDVILYLRINKATLAITNLAPIDKYTGKASWR